MPAWQSRSDRYDATAWGDDTPIPESRRPWTVLAGCLLAWIGATAGAFNGFLLLTLTPSSPALASFSVADRTKQVSFFHLLGTGLLIWCLAVMVVAVFAFRRARWAALTLLVLGIIWTLASIFNGLGGAGLGVVLSVGWVVASITLLYFARQSKDWFAN
jgi:hypothetical protein